MEKRQLVEKRGDGRMPYNELINDYEFVRDYLREFYIYGYRTKEETVSKQSRKHTQENKGTSNRSYEDKKSRFEAGC